ncbi:hypothetical protein ACFYZ9_38110 [Streptomyces sp. NPDC001691]|uniref:hypothetical protein n=1 Tax=Streptomyces sp. NPDC001691 TaxID=3364600 RepID=UPI0036B43D8D
MGHLRPTEIRERPDSARPYVYPNHDGVIRVQHCNGLSEDGIVGPRTREKLYHPNYACQRFDN